MRRRKLWKRLAYGYDIHIDINQIILMFIGHNLNLDFLNIKVVTEKMKTFGCLCCESGPLNLKVTLNKNGFVPGEYVEIKAEVNILCHRLAYNKQI